MRITYNTISNKVLTNLNQNSEKLNKASNQVSSGKKFEDPSDDPAAFINSMQLNSQIKNNEQYLENIDSSTNWLSTTEDALDSAGDVLNSLNELAVEASNDTLTEDDRNKILIEVEELEKEIINIANTQLGDKYLFSGTATDTETYDENRNYQGNSSKVLREVNDGTKIEINLNGDQVFADALTATSSFKDALNNNDSEELSNTVISDINQAIDTNNTYMAEAGAKQNRLDFTTERLEAENESLEEILSSNEDVDIAEAITNYSTQQTVYQASLSVSASILQTSLVDYVSS
jgi:flagellar hook-associated protein 3 FlgL